MDLSTKFHRPTFDHLEVIMLTNKQSNKQTNKQTNKQVGIAENIHFASLCYAGGKSSTYWTVCVLPDYAVLTEHSKQALIVTTLKAMHYITECIH